MTVVWKRLKQLNYRREVHELSFLLVHNKLPLQERLFRIHMSPDPYCDSCPTAIVQDIIHFFAKCDRVQRYWVWTKTLCMKMLNLKDIMDDYLLRFHWPVSRRDRDISWLISHYFFIVWDMLAKRRLSLVNEGEFFGFMRFKYREALASQTISIINGLM